MKRILLSIIMLLYFIPNCMGSDIVVSTDTIVKVAPRKITTSRNIPKSYMVKGTILENVYINDTLVFAVDDKAQLRVEDYQKARCWGRGGTLKLNGGFVYDTKGNKHPVNLTLKIIGENDPWFTRIIPFNKGKQAMIYPNNIIESKIISEFKY